MLGIRDITIANIYIRIVVAMILGGIIGLERGVKNRPAGLRTYMLVCIGACTVMLVNQYAYQVYGVGDPVRMGAQVVSGIGFLGAGTIIVTSHNQIKGLTTAAGLWASACVGLATGIGLYEVAVASSLSIFLVLTILHGLDFGLRSKSSVVEAYIEMDQRVSLGTFLRNARDQDLEVSNIQKENLNEYSDSIIAFTVTIKGKKSMYHDEIIRIVRKFEGVRYLETL